MSYMLDEIHEQPEVLSRLIEREKAGVRAVRRAMQERGVEYISIAARGTSDNAAALGKYLLEIAAGTVVSLAAPSVFTLYDSEFDLSRWCVLGISQSGESTDVVEVVKRSREMGALTVGITNVPTCSLGRAAEFTLLCHAGEEKSVAATKTYTAALGIIYLLASAIASKPEMLDGVGSAARAMRAVFDIEDRIARVVERYRYMSECMVIARGINQATCQEAALKLAEICYIGAKPYSAADLMHGPIAAIDEGFPVFLYAPPGKGYRPLVELADKLAERGAEMITISTEDEILSRATTPIKLPVGVDEVYSPLVYIVVGQLFAQYLSVTKGYNPDQPRGLSKITKTL